MTQKEAFKPYIPAEKRVKEFSFRAIFIGIIFSFLFAISNAYLALKIGTTISASIPAAILSMALFRVFFKNGTILENNLVQTVATVGEALAAGVVFTIPALFFLGVQPSILQIFILTVLGGILGILFMIPMRRFLIVEEHGILPFPEGTACAEILKAGQESTSSAMMAGIGMITAVVYKVCCNVLHLWKETPTWVIKPFQKTQFTIDATPALLGVGYIVGLRVSSIIFSGGVLAWWIVIPLIKMFGLGDITVFPSHTPIDQMNASDIWNNYVRYIGAGTIATGGILSLIKIIPLLIKTFRATFKDLFSRFKGSAHVKRTDRDINLSWLIIGSIGIILLLWLLPTLPMNLLTILILVVLGFFFTAVTSMTVGIVGSTSNPVSGMVITTLLITCLIFVVLGWTERLYLISAIVMSCVANIAICMAGTTSQDLKAGFLLGATPKSQQIAEIIGVFIPAIALGYTIYLLNSAYTIGSEALPAPQATLMAMIAKGVIEGELPYTLFFIGVVLGLFLQLIKIPVLPFAIGVYLPLSLTSAIMVGGIVGGYVKHRSKTDDSKEKGILLSSGLVAGDACTGIVIALLAILGVIKTEDTGFLPPYFTLIMYGLMAIGLGYICTRNKKR